VTACELAIQTLHNKLAGLWLRGLARTIYRRVVVMECRLDGTRTAVEPRIPARITLMNTEDVECYARFRPDLDVASIRRRLDRGHRCFVAWYAGQIVHAGWAATHEPWIDYLACDFPLEPGDVYQFDSHTAPAFQRLGLATARVAWMAEFFRVAGFRRLLAVVLPENTTAFGPLEKAGYRRCGWLRVVRLGRWRRVIFSRGHASC
jgi:RimJ/RimL family protein N-acetyltransferase